jgi:hypothetical protein
VGEHRQAIKVYVSADERRRVAKRAAACDLSLSSYLRRLGVGQAPKSTIDAQAVLSLVKVNADQGRLGGLLKLWLSDRPGTGAPAFDVRRVLRDIVNLLHFSGEHFGQFTASFSNWAGLEKPSAEWRRTGL